MTTVEGLVIAEKNVGESSKSITLLTKELGCIYVFVRAGSKSKRALASTQLFSYADFSLDEKRDAKNVLHFYFNSAQPIKLFYQIRLDAKKTALACYIADLLNFICQSSDDSEETLKLTLNTLHFLNENNRSDELLKSIFELRLLCECGHLPALLCCSSCFKAEDDSMRLDLRSGKLTCSSCAKENSGVFDVELDRTLLDIVRFIALVEQDRLFNFRISEVYQRKLTAFTERFVEYHCSKSFDTLRFYRLLK